jgi:hypothetical protein
LFHFLLLSIKRKKMGGRHFCLSPKQIWKGWKGFTSSSRWLRSKSRPQDGVRTIFAPPEWAGFQIGMGLAMKMRNTSPREIRGMVRAVSGYESAGGGGGGTAMRGKASAPGATVLLALRIDRVIITRTPFLFSGRRASSSFFPKVKHNIALTPHKSRLDLDKGGNILDSRIPYPGA